MNYRKEYSYEYDLLIPLSINIEASNRKEADEKLTEAVADYFAETELSITKKEIKSVNRYEC